MSNIDFDGDETDEDDLFANPNQDAFVDNELGLVGLSHRIQIDKNTFLKTVVGASTNYNEYLQDNLIRDANGLRQQVYRATNVQNRENRFTISSTLSKKFNARWSLRTGIINERYDLNLFVENRDNAPSIPDNDNDGIPDYLLTEVDFTGNFDLTQAFAQTEYKFTDDLSITGGVHTQYHSLTEDFALEPRFAISWQASPNQRWSFGYGLHAQSIPGPILFFREETSPGVTEQTNTNLEFMRSQHFILSYDRNFGPNWRLKAEAYYQDISNVPVTNFASSYSVLNEGADFEFEQFGSLVNEGTGRNYGVELTLEKFFSNDYYLLMTTSVFDSKYKGSDGVKRNTAFNNNYVFNALFGKEWKFGPDNKNAWTFDTKFTTAGGRPYTPIDLTATRQNAGQEVLQDGIAFTETYGEYFRWDVKVGVRLNSKKRNVSHQFFVDFQNVTNRKNEFVRRYNEVTDEINLVEQIGFFPDIMYRIQF